MTEANVTTTKNQQKLVYRGRYYTSKRTNRFRGTLSTNLEATEVIVTSEHAESCPVNPHAFYHHQRIAELRWLSSEDTRPVMEIYNELASNASTSLDTAAHFPTWNQAQHTMYNRRARRYPRLPKTGHVAYCLTVRKALPMYSQIFEMLLSKAKELGAQYDPAKFFYDFETDLIPPFKATSPTPECIGTKKGKNADGIRNFASEPCTRGFRNLKCWDVGSSGSLVPVFSEGVASSHKNFALEFSWFVCADQQPSGRLKQPHEQKST
ncbi:hypothetical protein T03_14677 [Trichinella britovi]|uniref:Uncharacterized protein n=2 Tax=Trichinella TaxID=6333 RepID=A0A0V1C769_TRIBR|nr:hypothetical protein T03_14677 [Trichinella britovi]